jgi:hypothetical protein
MYQYTPFIVISLADGAPQPVYRGLCTVGDYGEGYFSSI